MKGWHGTGPVSWENAMNHLLLIQQRILKAARLREAQLASLLNSHCCA
jgi:hypothetical protein